MAPPCPANESAKLASSARDLTVIKPPTSPEELPEILASTNCVELASPSEAHATTAPTIMLYVSDVALETAEALTLKSSPIFTMLLSPHQVLVVVSISLSLQEPVAPKAAPPPPIAYV